jgi:hypothetical protein
MSKRDLREMLCWTLLATALLIAGCSARQEPKTEAQNPAPAEQPSARQVTPAQVLSPTPAAAAPAIATADGETAGVRAEVQQLKRGTDNTLTLRFAIVNDSDKKVEFGYNFGDPANQIKDFASVGGITLVDGVNKKKYFVVRDTENNCVCSRELKAVEAKSRVNLWAKFPATPDDVQKIGVVIPHFGPLDDVPISR